MPNPNDPPESDRRSTMNRLLAMRQRVKDFIAARTGVDVQPIRISDVEGSITTDLQSKIRQARFGETEAQAMRIVEMKTITPAEHQKLLQELQEFDSQAASVIAVLETEADVASGPSAVSRLIRTAGVAIGDELIVSLMTIQSTNQIEAVVKVLKNRLNQLLTIRIDNGETYRAEVATMLDAIQALERRYRQLVPSYHGVIPGQRVDRIFNPLVVLRARVERRLDQQNNARVLKNPCVVFHLVAIERLVDLLHEIRSRIGGGSRLIEEQTGQFMNDLVNSLRQSQQLLYNGTYTPATVKRDIARIALDGDTPMNEAEDSLKEPLMTRYNNEFKQAIRAMQLVVDACPVTVVTVLDSEVVPEDAIGVASQLRADVFINFPTGMDVKRTGLFCYYHAETTSWATEPLYSGSTACRLWFRVGGLSWQFAFADDDDDPDSGEWHDVSGPMVPDSGNIGDTVFFHAFALGGVWPVTLRVREI